MSAFSSFGSTPSAFGSFGQNNQSSKPTPIFGQPSVITPVGTSQQQQQQPQQTGFGSSVFGSAPVSSNTFGSNNAFSAFGPQNQQQQQQQQPSSSTPSVFGSTPTSNNAFGSGNSFSAFGAQSQQNQQQPSTSTPSAFASLAPPPSAPSGGTGIFGSFGQQTNQNQQQQQQQQQGSQPTANPFASYKGFGSLGSTSSSSFAPPAQSQPLGTSIFGQPQSNPPTSQSIFGQPQQQSNLGLGASSSIFGTQPNLSTAGGNAVNSSSGSPVEAQVLSIYEAWNPQSPQCRFQHFFYNLVDPAEVYKYTRPPAATNDAIWQKAVRDNPNPSRLVPVLAVGFEDLKKRVQAQKSQAEAQLAGMQLLKKELNKMSETHTLRVLPRISALSHAQVELTAHLAKLIHHLHLFIPSVRSTSIRPDEEALRAQLEAIEAELRRPGGLGRVGGRIGELWGLVGRVRAQREAGRLGADREAGWAVVDGPAFEEIKQILFEEQQGLKYLTEVLRTALHDIDLIRSGLGTLDLSASSSA